MIEKLFSYFKWFINLDAIDLALYIVGFFFALFIIMRIISKIIRSFETH
ncbi:MAG: hypothetical protein ACK5BE_04695 [Alphaproteobacteria bacterium]